MDQLQMINNKNKNINNRRVFLCFRPIVVDEERFDQYCFEGDRHQVLARIKIGEAEEVMMVPAIGSSLMEDDKSPKSKPKSMKAWLQRGGGRRRSAQRIFSKIAKAVLFETKFTKRIRSRKIRQDPSRQVEQTDSNSNPNLTEEERIDPSQLSLSKSSSSLTSSSSLNRSSSSCLSSSNSCRISEPNQTSAKNPSNQTRITKNKNHSGWYLLVVSLVSVILFGRFLAVLWTATWLFLVPSRRNTCSAKEDNQTVTKNSNTDQSSLSRDRVNRVVLEGFLERNNNRRVC